MQRPIGMRTVVEWRRAVLQDGMEDLKDRWAMVMWTLWKCRNWRIFRGSSYSSADVVQEAHSYLEDFRRAKAQGSLEDAGGLVPTLNLGSAGYCWTLPPAGWLKLNVDGSLDVHNSRSGTGVVIRDAMGTLVYGTATPYPGLYNVAVVEAMACRRGSMAARELGILRLIVECDSQLVVAAMRGHKEDLTCFGDVIRECKVIADAFEEISFVYTSMTCNGVAHAVAQFALSLDSELSSFNPTPSWLVHLIDSDVTLSNID